MNKEAIVARHQKLCRLPPLLSQSLKAAAFCAPLPVLCGGRRHDVKWGLQKARSVPFATENERPQQPMLFMSLVVGDGGHDGGGGGHAIHSLLWRQTLFTYY